VDRVYADPPMSAFAAGSLWTLDPKAGELRSIPLGEL
jgi:hypothetical protein